MSEVASGISTRLAVDDEGGTRRSLILFGGRRVVLRETRPGPLDPLPPPGADFPRFTWARTSHCHLAPPPHSTNIRIKTHQINRK